MNLNNKKEAETWKEIPGYEGQYQASNLGMIKSLTRLVKNPMGGTMTLQGKFMSLRKDKEGYLLLNLCKDGKKKTFKAHRIIAQLFVANPNNLPEVNHDDGVKENIAASNLSWTDRAGNMQHAYDTGLRKSLKGQTTVRSKSIMQVDKDGKIVATFPSVSHASRATKIDDSQIGSCVNGVKHFKTAGGYQWVSE